MPATIRLKRMGRKKQSSFRIVVAEKSAAITGPAIENLGIYQPRTEPSLVRLDAERALTWLRKGAMPSTTVKSIFRKTGLWEKYHQGITPEELTEKEIRLGPPEGQLKTSGRARAAAAARERAEAEA
ncbi:MAG: 30S ribosomal protein S16, partial [Gemmatimonadota bacterium]